MDLVPGTISGTGVANTLNRSEDFAKRNWYKDPFNYEMDNTTHDSLQVVLNDELKVLESDNKGCLADC